MSNSIEEESKKTESQTKIDMDGFNYYLAHKYEIDNREQHILEEKKRSEEVREKDDKNQSAALGCSVLGAFGGAGLGIVLGFILALFSEIGSCISNGTEKNMAKNDSTIFILSIFVCTIIGALISYNSKRNKK